MPALSDTQSGYRVLARKYRPSSFADLIGQEAMVRTLRNAFATGRIAQGYMLTGVRGVGKTTTARIIARALNYETETVQAPTLDMPELGRHCAAIMESRHPDVLEMDAASNRGIDNVREIIGNAQYRPIEARMKVFIIDEVHMLTKEAFNSLLKTLEEPPEHVKFIFATTEIRKVPITILSRCQRFDLRRIDGEEVVSYLADVCAKESVEADKAALALIARAGEGSMRDSLSLLDQAIAYAEGGVEEEAVRDMLGLADRGRTIALFDLVAKGDIAGALKEMRAQHDLGADPGVVIADLLDIAHLVTRLKTVPGARDDLSLTQDERARGGDLADTLNIGMLTRAWQMLLKGLDEVRAAPNPLDAADMLLVRLAHASTLPTPEDALRVLQGETLPDLAQASAATETPAGEWTEKEDAPAALPQSQAQATPQGSHPPENDRPLLDLRPLHDHAVAAKDIRLQQALWSDARLAGADGRHLRIAGLSDDIARTLQAKLKTWTGDVWTIEPVAEAEAPTLKEQDEARRLAEIEAVKSDPNVAAVLSAFPGAEVEAVLDDEGEDAA
ncbi:MAG: DNA polymerase III subunit gamma/tau [Pseudomonadota bacterium]